MNVLLTLILACMAGTFSPPPPRPNHHTVLLLRAVRDGDVERTESLLSGCPVEGCELETHWLEDCTPLCWAARSGHVGIAKLLIEAGADLQARRKFGETPLHEAAIAGHVDVVRVFLDAGAYINTVDEQGWTPLYVAEQHWRLGVQELLRERGGSVEPNPQCREPGD